MAGHLREITWGSMSDEVHRRLGKLLEFILASENEYQELLQLWQLHANDDQAVADQLFGGTASAEQLEMTVDLKAAMIAAHDVYTTIDFGAIRKMT